MPSGIHQHDEDEQRAHEQLPELGEDAAEQELERP